MAPNFLSKLVKSTNTSHSRAGSAADRSFDSSRSNSPAVTVAQDHSLPPPLPPRPRTVSASAAVSASDNHDAHLARSRASTISPNPIHANPEKKMPPFLHVSAESSDSSLSKPPSVTVIPPSPLPSRNHTSASVDEMGSLMKPFDLADNAGRGRSSTTGQRQGTLQQQQQQPPAPPPAGSDASAYTSDFPSTSSPTEMDQPSGGVIRTRTLSAPNLHEDDLLTPTPNRSFTSAFRIPGLPSLSRPSSRTDLRSVSPANSINDLRGTAHQQAASDSNVGSGFSGSGFSASVSNMMSSFNSNFNTNYYSSNNNNNPASSKTLEPPKEAKRKTSNKSLKQGAPSALLPTTDSPPTMYPSIHIRSATAPASALAPAPGESNTDSASSSPYQDHDSQSLMFSHQSMAPVVESPKAIKYQQQQIQLPEGGLGVIHNGMHLFVPCGLQRFEALILFFCVLDL